MFVGADRISIVLSGYTFRLGQLFFVIFAVLLVIKNQYKINLVALTKRSIRLAIAIILEFIEINRKGQEKYENNSSTGQLQ